MKTIEKSTTLIEIVAESNATALHKIGTDVWTPNGGRATILKTDIDQWEEAVKPPYTKAEYDAKVAELVRERYTADEEFALQRKAINAAFSPSVADDSQKAMSEYAEYNTYIESCKAKAKDPELYILK